MITDKRPVDHFAELVTSAMEHQRIKAGELARLYISTLLASYVTSARLTDKPLAVRYLEALAMGRAEQTARFRELGDMALFISGFFSDSLKGKLVDIDYYILLGANSYGYVASLHRDGADTAGLYEELSEKFKLFVDVLSEVSERCRLTSSTDILRVYERWLATRSAHAAKILRDQGIEPLDVGGGPLN